MDILRDLFPNLPDFILLSFLAAANRNIETTQQNIRRALNTNQFANLFQIAQIQPRRERVPARRQIARPILIGSSDSENEEADQQFHPMPRPVLHGWGMDPQPVLFRQPQFDQPTPRLPQRTTKISGIDFTMPTIPVQAQKIIENSIKVAPDMDFSRGSAYLELVIQTDKYPEDIVDRLLLAAADARQMPSPNFAKDSLAVLQNMFYKVSIQNIKKALHENKRLLSAINKMNSEPPPAMKTPRKKETKLVITDLFVAYDLSRIEEEENKKREKEEAVKREEREMEEARENGSLIECSCCCCDVPIDRCLQCPEGHLFCKDCVMKMIETTISEGRSSVKCPSMEGCDMDIPMSELERMIPEKTLQRLFQTEAINDIVKSGLDHIVKCYNCGFMVEFIGDGNMRCPHCQKETCSKCGLASHPGKTCDEAKALDPDKMIEEKMNDAIIRICPNCKTPFTKDEGCNKMVCPRCDTWICYWCRKVIPKDVGYDHFWRSPGPCPPDKCPLWVENKQLHVIEAAKAKLDAKGELEEM